MADKKKKKVGAKKHVKLNPKGLLGPVVKRQKDLDDVMNYGEAPSGKRGI